MFRSFRHHPSGRHDAVTRSDQTAGPGHRMRYAACRMSMSIYAHTHTHSVRLSSGQVLAQFGRTIGMLARLHDGHGLAPAQLLHTCTQTMQYCKLASARAASIPRASPLRAFALRSSIPPLNRSTPLTQHGTQFSHTAQPHTAHLLLSTCLPVPCGSGGSGGLRLWMPLLSPPSAPSAPFPRHLLRLLRLLIILSLLRFRSISDHSSSHGHGHGHGHTSQHTHLFHDQCTNHKSMYQRGGEFAIAIAGSLYQIKKGERDRGREEKVSIHTSSYSMQIVAQHWESSRGWLLSKQKDCLDAKVGARCSSFFRSFLLRLTVKLHKMDGARAAREARKRRLDVRLVDATAQRGELRRRRRVAHKALR